MSKLWKESNRVKSILSANTDATITVGVAYSIRLIHGSISGQIEDLAYNIDLKAKVTRTAFEDMCSDIRERFAQPIYDALEQAGLTLVSLLFVTSFRPFPPG